MRQFLPRKLPQTQDAMDAMATTLLTSNGLDVDEQHLRMVGAYIQNLPEGVDSFVPYRVIQHIRKAKANFFAFYLINPARREKDGVAPLTTNEAPQDKATEVRDV